MKNKIYLYMAPSKPPKIDKDDFGIKRRIMKAYERQPKFKRSDVTYYFKEGELKAK